MTAITTLFDGSPREGLAIGVRQAATPLGGILAASLFPWLVKSWSLSGVLFLIAINAGGWTMAFGWALGSVSTPAKIHPPSPGIRGILHQTSSLKYPLLISFLLSPGQYALLTYALLDLHDRWHVPMTTAGPILALALFGGFVMRIIMGKKMDKGKDTRQLIVVTAIIGVLALIAWALIPHGTPIYVVMVLFFVLGAGLDGWNALLTTWVTQNTTSSNRGIGLALTGMAGFIGIALFLPIFGFLVTDLASYRPGWMVSSCHCLSGSA
jgi:MFS family permease